MTLSAAPNVKLSEVEWRVDGKPAKRNDGSDACRFVPYIGAATAASLLDEWVTPAGWKDDYVVGQVAGKEAMWCHLSIKDGDEWVTKTDIGVPTQFEGQKGAVSDAFKRVACLKWGVARNVYSLPTLWAPCRVDTNGKAWPNERTIPSILSQLEKAGYEADGARVQIEEVSAGSAESPSAEPQAAPVASPPSESAQNSWAEEGTGGGESPSASPSSDPSADWRELGDRYGKAPVLKTARDTIKDLDVKEALPQKFEALYDIKDTRVAQAVATILAERLVRT